MSYRHALYSRASLYFFRLFLILPFSLSFFIFTHNVSAASEIYQFTNGGQQITATSGRFADSEGRSVIFNSQSEGYVGYFTQRSGGAHPCSIKLLITNPTNNSHGTYTLSVPDPYNTDSCPANYFKTGSSEIINVSGSSTGADSIKVVVYSKTSPSSLPQPTTAALTNTNQSININWNNDTGAGEAYFDNVTPDTTYTVCINPISAFDFTQCQNGFKRSGQSLTMTFGDANSAYNINNLANINVNIVLNPFDGSRTYGPTDITIYDSSNIVVRTYTTNSRLVDKTMVNATLTVQVSLKPGDYKACLVKKLDLCTSFTKTANDTQKNGRLYNFKTVTISVPAGDSDLFLVSQSSSTACSIDGIGWILCPVLRFMGKIADGSFGVFDGFLQTKPELFNTNSSTYKAWEIMRNIANIAFAIAFIIIISSQLTGIGITNFGVKKLLPRIVIAAVLVNLSYIICQILVDFSNITGQSLKGLFDGITSQIPGVSGGTWNGNNGWTNGLGTIIAVGAGATIAWSALATLIPALVSVVIAFIMILFILAARQAIIVLLIVISPLAFVAFLLPNTEPWFKRWRTTLLSMLLLFPIVSVVYGASTLASGVLTAAFTGNILGQIVAAAIKVLPLFLVPSLLKKSLNAVGNIGATINSLGGKISGAASGKAGKLYERSGVARSRKIKEQAKEDFRTRQFARRVSEGKTLDRRFGRFARRVPGVEGLINRIPRTEASKFAGQALERITTATAQKAEEEDIKAEGTLLSSQGYSNQQYLDIIASGNLKNGAKATSQQKEAAMRAIEKHGSFENIISLADHLSQQGSTEEGQNLQKSFASIMETSSRKPKFLSGKNIDELRQGKLSMNVDSMIKRTVADGKISMENLATMDKDELQRFQTVISTVESTTGPDAIVNNQNIKDFKEVINGALVDPIIGTRISGDKKDILRKISPNGENRRRAGF